MGTQLRNLIVSLMLFIGSVTAVCAQTILVQGKVLDSRGTPLPKVSVTVKLDNSKHTTTDKEGKFSLQVPEKSVLVFTLTGKKTIEAPATTTPLEITLEDGEEQQKGSTVTTMRQTTSIQTKYYPLWVIDGVVYNARTARSTLPTSLPPTPSASSLQLSLGSPSAISRASLSSPMPQQRPSMGTKLPVV